VPRYDNKNVKTIQKEGKREIKSVNADTGHYFEYLHIVAGSINWNHNLGERISYIDRYEFTLGSNHSIKG
jgi:hypothetical protein